MKSTAVLLLAFTMSAGAQSRPDFSGTWVLERVEADPARGSGMGGPGMGRPGMGGPGMGGPMRGPGRGGPAGRGPGGMGDPGGPDLREEPGMTIVITQGDAFLTIERRIGDASITARYALDGTETVHNGRMGGVMKSKSRWEGVAIVTESRETVSTPRGEMTLKLKEIRSPSADGKTLTVRATTETPGGDRTRTLTFRRQEG